MTLGEHGEKMEVDGPSDGHDDESGSEWESEAPPLLSSDCMGCVFSFLEVKDLGVAAQVSWQWSDVAGREFLWKEFTLRRWIFATDKGEETWRGYHMRIHTRGARWERGRPADFKMMPLRGHTAPITAAILEGDTVVSGSLDRTVRVWARQGKEYTATRTLEASGEVRGLSATEDLGAVFANTGKSIVSWDVESGAAAAEYSLRDAGSTVQSFSVDDDNDVVVGGSDGGAVFIWDSRTSKPPHLSLAGHNSNPILTTLAAWDKRQQIVAGSTSGLVIWDTRQTGQPLVSVDIDQCSCLEWDPSSDTACWGTKGGGIACLNTRTGGQHSAHGAVGRGVSCIAIEGSQVAAGFEDGGILFNRNAVPHSTTPWRATEGRHKGRVNSIKLDGIKIVSGGGDNCSLLFDATNGQQLYALLGGSMQARANNPPLPDRPWVSGIQFDAKQVLATVNSMLRVYHFDLSPL